MVVGRLGENDALLWEMLASGHWASGWLVSSEWFLKVLCIVVAVSCINLRVLQMNFFLKKKSMNTTDCGQLSCRDGIRHVVYADGVVQKRGLPP